MSLIREIERIARKPLPHYATLKLLVRGYPLYLDPLLKGEARFARKVGSPFGVLNPDVVTTTTSSILYAQTAFTVDRILRWYEPGCILDIGRGKEYMEIQDIDVESKQIFTTPFFLAHDVGERVALHAVPCYSYADYSAGVNVFQLRSKYRIVKNDEILIEKVEGVIRSSVKYKVLNAKLIAVEPNLDGMNYRQQIELDDDLIRSLTSASKVWLRAYPSYVSKMIIIPDGLGPFLIDFMGGRIRSKYGLLEEESFSATFFAKYGEKILSDYPIEVGKNYPIVYESMPSDWILFWDLKEGHFSYDYNKPVAVCNDDGYFNAVKRIIPPLPPATWTLNATADRDCKLVVWCASGSTEYQLVTQVPKRITVGCAEDITEFRLCIKGDPGTHVSFDDWFPTAAEAAKIEYTMLVKIVDEAEWQCSGLILKPYFINLDLVKGRFDTGIKYDGGVIFF
jgi:hypothetical protein